MIAVTPLGWIKEPDEKKTGILSTYIESPVEMIPLPVLTKGIPKEDIEIGEKQFLDIVLSGGTIISIYADEEEYLKSPALRPPESIDVTILDEAIGSAVPLSAMVTGKVREVLSSRPSEDPHFTDLIFNIEILGNDYPAEAHCLGDLPKAGNTVLILGPCPTAEGGN